MGISRTASTDCAVLRHPADCDREDLLSLEDLRDRGAADGRLHHRVDVARVEPIAGARFAVDHDLHVGLAHGVEDAQVGDAFDARDRRGDLVRVLLVLPEVGETTASTPCWTSRASP
jgi:hypothetical protein